MSSRVLVAALGVLLCASPVAGQATYQGHGAESVSREKIRQFAPPPLPSEVTRRIQASLDVRAPGSGMLSPDGRRLYFGWSITGTPAVWRVDGPRAFPVQMTGGEDRTMLVDITPDGQWLILGRDRGGQEDPGIYLQPAMGGAPVQVFHAPKVQAFYEFTSTDGKFIYYRANDIKPTSYAIYRHPVAGGQRELLFSEDGLWSISDRRESGGDVTLLLSKATGSVSSEYYEWSSRTKALKPLFGQNERVDYSALFAADADELVVLTNKFGEFQRLYRWKAGKFAPVTPEMTMDVTRFSMDEAKRRLYYGVNDGGYQRARALDARTYEPLQFPEISNAEQVAFGAASRDGRYVILSVGTSKAPSSSYVYDWDTRALTQWVLPSAPETDTSRFAVARLETYPARDGTPIPMFVRYPDRCAPESAPPAEPCPIVVEFHGGPEGQATPGFSTFAQTLVDSGFIFVEPNVRGSMGYGKSWLDADNGAKRLNVITDIDDAGKYLRQKFTRNGKAPKIAITGGSYGGYSALIGMTMFAGTYDAGVSVVGISNLLTFLNNTAPYRRALRASEYGDPEKDAEALRQLSPTTYLERVKGPLLIIQGVDDPRVPVGESIQVHEQLVSRGVKSQLMLLEGEGHGAARRSGQVIMRGAMLHFLEQQLLAAPATPPTH